MQFPSEITQDDNIYIEDIDVVSEMTFRYDSGGTHS